MEFTGFQFNFTHINSSAKEYFKSLFVGMDIFGNPIEPSAKVSTDVLDLNDVFGTPEPIKSVQFTSETKTHDGLKESSNMFQEYMKDVFQKKKRHRSETIVSLLARGYNIKDIQRLRSMLYDLMIRCRENPKGNTPILPKGGGSVGCVGAVHLPYLERHLNHLDNVIDKVSAAIKELAQNSK